jgi:hypothetical protein
MLASMSNKKTPEAPPPLLMTMPEAAGLLHMSVRWLQQQVTDGIAPIVHAGRSARMRRSDVESFARDGKWPKTSRQDEHSPLSVVVSGTQPPEGFEIPPVGKAGKKSGAGKGGR